MSASTARCERAPEARLKRLEGPGAAVGPHGENLAVEHERAARTLERGDDLWKRAAHDPLSASEEARFAVLHVKLRPHTIELVLNHRERRLDRRGGRFLG